MITLVPDLPSHVVIAEAHGEVTAEDYDAVLIPAVEAARTEDAKLRLLYILGTDFAGYAPEALLDDTRLGMRHWTDFDRIGLVTDHEAYRVMAKAFGFLMPGEVRVYGLADRDTAEAWITEA